MSRVNALARLFAPALAAAALAGCAGGDSSAEPAVTTPPPPPATSAPSEETPEVGFARSTVTVATGDETVTVAVEIAETDEQRERGLMFRRSLPQDAGMVFLFPEDVSGAFWMKDTLVPLSIAFFDRDGRIIRILDMEPCRTDPCPTYDPGTSYRGALEVNRGAFVRWGVEPGDRITLRRS